MEPLHCCSSRHQDTSSPEAKFNEAQVGESYHTGQDMAADFAVCPMADGHDAHEIIIL
jgi:hypothetical protein